ncbi:tyrosyl-DNA phosphodiesterase-domain-containing protein [Fomitopsis serialis]|uniref:tyrosyl-DNA phosphodiesterase-domain-containing protein n=1 Tax=Fomitopsis serialis TaxID=139415 RepID=UPI0020078D35|nr:tyrosyl-DNA phosphodiesterase-domain-containing protein [Neoantrodia serialis]KAH9929332.1 tyrosyl-DNA phosphodiesterase-domain-containing protein [Neoantrodia serialis]
MSQADDFQDDDLARTEGEVIEISDSDDEDVIEVNDEDRKFQSELQQAIEASKKEEARRAASQAPIQPAVTPDLTVSAPSATGFLSERAQLERERLARQKRLRSDLDAEGSSGVDSDAHRSKRQHLSSSSGETRRADVYASSSAAYNRPSASTSAQRQSASTTATSSSSQQWYWDGEMRQIANMHVDPARNTRPTFRLSDILAPRDEIDFAIVSAYMYNFPWLYSMLSPRTPVIAVAQDPQGQETIKAILPNWIKTTPFLRNGMGCMHMKLFYKTGRLRVVISTANMIEYDWRDIENTAWVQDVPKRSSPIAHDPKADDFPSAFARVLRALQVEPALLSHVKNDHPNLPLQRLEHIRTHWDFSKVKAKLIPSIAGKHEGWPKVILTGHPSLMKALRDLRLNADKSKEVTLECQGSSIGSYSTQWMNEFHCSARGESAQTWLDVSKARRAKLPYPPIKVLFPTAQYVHESVLGDQGGGTMFCRRTQWEAAKFPRDLFHQSRSKRGRVLMHSKMILGTIRDKSAAFGTSGVQSDSETEPEDDPVQDSRPSKPVGWLYAGSHNFTPSAWGTLSGSAFNPTLNITNYELGILLPIYSEDEANRLTCWERPPRKYALGRDEPWIQSESPAFAEDLA